MRLYRLNRFVSEYPALTTHPVLRLLKIHLEPMLGIADQRTDNRIDFVGGIRGLGELEKRVNSGEMAIAFSFYPTRYGSINGCR